LVAIRIKEYTTDLLISLNVPDKIVYSEGGAPGQSTKYQQLLTQNEQIFKTILESFSVTDQDKLRGLFIEDVNDDIDME
jgi:hypothetical protein